MLMRPAPCVPSGCDRGPNCWSTARRRSNATGRRCSGSAAACVRPTSSASSLIVTLLPPQLEVSFGPGRQESTPVALEAGPVVLEGLCCPVSRLARIAARSEAAVPPPLRSVNRNAGSWTNVSDADIAPVDEPATGQVRVVVGLAGELRHVVLVDRGVNSNDRGVSTRMTGGCQLGRQGCQPG